MGKGLIDPTTGEQVFVEKRYLEDEIGKRHDETAALHYRNRKASNRRGVLVHVRKADDSPSGGRRAAAGLLPGYHGAVAGRKGKKLRSYGNEAGGALLGGAALHLATRGKLIRNAHGAMMRGVEEGIGRMAETGNPMHLYRGMGRGMKTKEYATYAGAGLASSAAGAQLGVNRNQRKGYYKPQKVTTSKRAGVFIPGGVITNVSTGQGHTWERSGTSHANDPTIVRRRKRHTHPDDKLFQLKRGRRSVSGTSVGKMYSETGHGVGRRLVEV